jgi:hypothetical protein
MPFSVICTGCGEPMEVPDDYPRRKMRCPECGVMCEIPPPGKERIPVRPKTSRAPRPDSPSPLPLSPEGRGGNLGPRSPEVKEGNPGPRSPDAREGNMGRGSPEGRRGRHSADEERAWREGAAEPTGYGLKDDTAPVVFPIAELADADDDDGKPYLVSGGVPKPCPNCKAEMEPTAVVCISCGYDRRTRKTPKKTHEPFERTWEPGLPFARRLQICLALMGAFFLLGLGGTIASREWLSFILSWLTFTGMMLFLFGTYDRVNLTRNERGQVRLYHALRFGFIEFKNERIVLGDYEGIVTGRVSEWGCFPAAFTGLLLLSGLLSAMNIMFSALAADQIGFLEYIGMLFFLVLGFVPAGIAYVVFFHKIQFFVALSEAHGYPAKKLYQGWDEAYSVDVAATVSKITTLAYRTG